MKNIVKLLGITALVAVIVFSMAGCKGKDAKLLEALESGDAEKIEKAISTSDATVLAKLANTKGTPGGDFSYEKDNNLNGIVITKYSGEGGVVIIPAKIEDIPVVRIGNAAFQGSNNSYEENSGDKITAVVIPEGVRIINARAFRFCRNLTTVLLPASLEEIEGGDPDGNRNGRGAFAYCAKLHTINLPSGVTLGDNAFRNCGELYNLSIPDSLNFAWWDGKAEFRPTLGSGYSSSEQERMSRLRNLPGFVREEPLGSSGATNIFYKTMDQFRGAQKLKLADRQRLQDLGYIGEF
jgi:hypothetical protein